MINLNRITNGFIFVVALVCLTSCSQPNKSADKQTSQVPDQKELPELNFKDNKIKNIYSSYIELKNNLVNTNFAAAKKSANTLSAQLKIYNGCENTALTAANIENSTDIAEQRKQFTILNTDIIALFKHADLKEGIIYVQHCPMANNGDGADWLSSEKKIQNPYYGSEMMECGSVVEQINPTK